jgi:hypothetical protein
MTPCQTPFLQTFQSKIWLWCELLTKVNVAVYGDAKRLGQTQVVSDVAVYADTRFLQQVLMGRHDYLSIGHALTYWLRMFHAHLLHKVS